MLLLAGIVGAMAGLRRGDDLATLLAVGAVLVLAFYFLPTRVHERYLFPAMALLVPFAVATGGQFVAYLVLAAGFAASLLYALHDTTPFDLPGPLADALVSPAGRVDHRPGHDRRGRRLDLAAPRQAPSAAGACSRPRGA